MCQYLNVRSTLTFCVHKQFAVSMFDVCWILGRWQLPVKENVNNCTYNTIGQLVISRVLNREYRMPCTIV